MVKQYRDPVVMYISYYLHTSNQLDHSRATGMDLSCLESKGRILHRERCPFTKAKASPVEQSSVLYELYQHVHFSAPIFWLVSMLKDEPSDVKRC